MTHSSQQDVLRLIPHQQQIQLPNIVQIPMPQDRQLQQQRQLEQQQGHITLPQQQQFTIVPKVPVSL